MQTRHYFIFNPAAGARNARALLDEQLGRLGDTPYTRLVTGAPGDAARLVKEICSQEPGPLRFYACGGDGTLGEVAGGAIGHPQAEVGVWPCGSGNDYTKLYGGPARFLELSRQLAAPSVPVDLMLANGRPAINVINLGLEAQAAATMLRFRHHPLMGGRRAYLMGVLDAVTSHLRTACQISADGEDWHAGDLFTASFACGRYIGGGFHCAPRSQNDDGLMDACLILPFPRLALLRLLPIYKQGGHLDNPLFRGRVLYRRAKTIQIRVEHETALCLDGEIITGREFALNILPRAARFILPPPV